MVFHMTMDEAKEKAADWLIELIKSVGFPIVVCGFVLWIGAQMVKEDRDARKEIEFYTRTEMKKTIEANTDAMRSLTQSIDRIGSRP